jgi:hypothetical protein
MIPASGAGGREFDSRITPFFCSIAFFVSSTLVNLSSERGCLVWTQLREHGDKTRAEPGQEKKRLVRTGTRTQNLLLRRQAPYPLGHTDINDVHFDPPPLCTCHSSLGVEHPLSKRKVVGSNPACGSPISFFGQSKFCWERGRVRKLPTAGSENRTDPVLGGCTHPENPKLLL